MESNSEASRQRKAGRPGPWEGAECKAAFAHAAETKPWTLAYQSCRTDSLTTENLTVEGELPSGLHGTFYRNGPTGHERGAQRYGHRWDGDGMVHAFRFGGAVSHHGRYVQTSKYVAEKAANRFLTNAFGTYLPGTPPVPEDIDSQNSANISVCIVGDDLLALWEPGSAYRLDPSTLETRGIKTWGEALRGRAFSAHPKREPDGTLWNFGTNPLTSELVLYCIARDGTLKRSTTLTIDRLPFVHDFAVTEHHLVFLLSPLPVNAERLNSGTSFAQACDWQPALGTRVLVVAKADWSSRWYELPPCCVFHLANAWEDRSGVIRLQFFGAETPIPLVSGWTIMQGQYAHRPGAFMTLVELDPLGEAKQTIVHELEGEFPVVAPGVVGQRNGAVLCLGRSQARDASVPGFDQLVMFSVEDGKTQWFDYGPDFMVEEHIYVPESSAAGAPATWIVGTALDMRRKQTVLSVFRAVDVAAGPIAQATLPYALPIGLHGCFAAAS